jgi:hypothetical protein
MALAIDKSQREKAKLEGKAIVQISIDGKHLSLETAKQFGIGMRGVALTGVVSHERAAEVYGLIDRWLKENSEE